jgi:hypothetical protein
MPKPLFPQPHPSFAAAQAGPTRCGGGDSGVMAAAGTIKGLTTLQLQALECQVILGNTYHLELRPGSKLMAEMGGLHKFMVILRPALFSPLPAHRDLKSPAKDFEPAGYWRRIGMAGCSRTRVGFKWCGHCPRSLCLCACCRPLRRRASEQVREEGGRRGKRGRAPAHGHRRAILGTSIGPGCLAHADEPSAATLRLVSGLWPLSSRRID